MKAIRSIMLYLFIALTLFEISCGPTVIEESDTYLEPAEITVFVVPDSADSDNIPVSIEAILGTTTASRLESIRWGLNDADSLFTFEVWAEREDKLGEQYEEKDILLDTTLILTLDPQRTGLHYFRIFSNTGDTLRDTTQLY